MTIKKAFGSLLFLFGAELIIACLNLMDYLKHPLVCLVLCIIVGIFSMSYGLCLADWHPLMKGSKNV